MARYIGTTTPLDNAGVYTTDLQATSEDWLVGLVFANQVGALRVWQSSDGTYWDYGAAIIVVNANVAQIFKEEVFAPYLRIVYTNGATPQTVFRLSARFSSAGTR